MTITTKSGTLALLRKKEREKNKKNKRKKGKERKIERNAQKNKRIKSGNQKMCVKILCLF